MPNERNCDDRDYEFEATEMIELEDETDVESESPRLVAMPQNAVHVPASESLGWNVLQRALTSEHRRLLSGATGAAIIVEVPSCAWVEPIKIALARMQPPDCIEARDGSDRRGHRPDQGNDRISERLSFGRNVIGISPSPLAHLPSALIGAADAWIKITISDAALKDTIAAATGQRPRKFPAGLAIGLDPHDVAAAIRIGESPAKAVDRLRAAISARTVVDRNVVDAPPFESLCGFGAAKVWCDELIADVAAWRRGEIKDFSSISTRAVFISPPGLGKSTLVRSLAQALNVPLIVTSVSQWFSSTDGHLNSVIKAIDEVFDAAKSVSPALIFLDEIDAIPNRATVDKKNRDYWLPIITYILLKLDSAISGSNSRTIIIGAANHATLDEALTRPGRLNSIICIERPDVEAREGILRAHLKGDLAEVNLKAVAELAVGTTGADLADAVKKARRAARIAARDVTLIDLMQAVAPPDTRSASDRRVIAVHEAGHAVARVALGFDLLSVSIIERGDAGGLTIGNGPGGVADRAMLESYIVILLCGRAAEHVLLGPISSGAGGGLGSDLALAAGMAASLRASFGLADTLLWRGTPTEAAQIASRDPGLRAEVDADLKRLYGRALHLMTTQRASVAAVAERLLRDRYLSGEDVRRAIAEADRMALVARSQSVGGRL